MLLGTRAPSAASDLYIPSVARTNSTVLQATSVQLRAPLDFGFASFLIYTFIVNSSSTTTQRTVSQTSYTVLPGNNILVPVVSFTFSSQVTSQTFSLHTAAVVASNSFGTSLSSPCQQICYTPSVPRSVSIFETVHEAARNTVTLNASWLLPSDQGLLPAGTIVYNVTLESLDGAFQQTVVLAPPAYNLAGNIVTPTTKLLFFNSMGFNTSCSHALSVTALSCNGQAPSVAGVGAVGYSPSHVQHITHKLDCAPGNICAADCSVGFWFR